MFWLVYKRKNTEETMNTSSHFDISSRFNEEVESQRDLVVQPFESVFQDREYGEGLRGRTRRKEETKWHKGVSFFWFVQTSRETTLFRINLVFAVVATEGEEWN